MLSPYGQICTGLILRLVLCDLALKYAWVQAHILSRKWKCEYCIDYYVPIIIGNKVTLTTSWMLKNYIIVAINSLKFLRTMFYIHLKCIFIRGIQVYCIAIGLIGIHSRCSRRPATREDEEWTIMWERWSVQIILIKNAYNTFTLVDLEDWDFIQTSLHPG